MSASSPQTPSSPHRSATNDGQINSNRATSLFQNDWLPGRIVGGLFQATVAVCIDMIQKQFFKMDKFFHNCSVKWQWNDLVIYLGLTWVFCMIWNYQQNSVLFHHQLGSYRCEVKYTARHIQWYLLTSPLFATSQVWENVNAYFPQNRSIFRYDRIWWWTDQLQWFVGITLHRNYRNAIEKVFIRGSTYCLCVEHTKDV